MATTTTTRILTRVGNFRHLRQFSNNVKFHNHPNSNLKVLGIGACGVCVGGMAFWLRNKGLFGFEVQSRTHGTVYALEPKLKDDHDQYPISNKELRFRSFASRELDGQIYMTMQDFLESVTEENPRPRIGRFMLQKKDVSSMLDNTPRKKKITKDLFRTIWDKGVISYTEYLFLLCILTKPKAGYEIAFKMFDRDGNERIDRREFLLMEEIFRKKSEQDDDDDETVSLLSKYAGTPGSKTNNHKKELKVQETTLLRYFFGAQGKDTLDFNTFYTFMDNLQAEVLELEFYEFSKGMPKISEPEFAHVLLRYTHIDDDEREVFVQRVKERMPEEKGIEFKDFKDFLQFLNNLDDFEIVLKMYTFAERPVTQGEFRRAVEVATGHKLHPHVVDTVFQIFDRDGDGKLSQKEFIGVMKNRVYRGFRGDSYGQEYLRKPIGWAGFKACVKKELKHAR